MEVSARSASANIIDAAAINRAALLLAPVIRSTPLERCDRLSIATGAPVLLKREDTQIVRSYKVRGAYNLIASLPEDARAKGVVCASAGNHAQGVAFSCAALGIPGRVFLPATTPRQKRERIRAIGGDAVEILVRGSTYDETSAIAIEEAAVPARPTCAPSTRAPSPGRAPSRSRSATSTRSRSVPPSWAS